MEGQNPPSRYADLKQFINFQSLVLDGMGYDEAIGYLFKLCDLPVPPPLQPEQILTTGSPVHPVYWYPPGLDMESIALSVEERHKAISAKVEFSQRVLDMLRLTDAPAFEISEDVPIALILLPSELPAWSPRALGSADGVRQGQKPHTHNDEAPPSIPDNPDLA